MIIHSRFQPAWWLSGPHLQTIWPSLFRQVPHIALRRERLELSDGDFIDLDWSATRSGPLALVFHGLEGSSRSRYALGIIKALQENGFQGVVVHFRGCSGEPNRLLRSYHAGESQDIHQAVDHILHRFPDRDLVGIGYSLGGNALLKWLGEVGTDAPLLTAVAVSVPFDLFQAADRLEGGVSRIYQRYLMNKLKRSAQRKQSWPGFPLSPTRLRTLTKLREFDNLLTAPLHGFKGYRDYYSRCSCKPYLRKIAIPTLVIHARDDPFMFETVMPREQDLSECVTLEISDRGGHVGFVAGSHPFSIRYWLDERIAEWLIQQKRSGNA